MSDTIIRVENLGKKYIIGHQQEGRARYVALRDVLANGASRLLKSWGKRESNPAREEFWALKDVSFEVKQGEVIGIIGRNGAGKSTLLKVLSRITEPTTGRISIKGRVASLLEVGTGFHPELTGRENIYLNGAILGMSKAEIKKKFDEIVAFAEVEKFLDTPVKRYSSGMYVRLAFAVAAHLEPEILVVDEVLAVGDAAFQKKCLGKMGDVATKEGRTVLFVSHNMAAVEKLCTQGIVLNQGILKFTGAQTEAITHYLTTFSEAKTALKERNDHRGSGEIIITNIEIKDKQGNLLDTIKSGQTIDIYFYFKKCSQKVLNKILVGFIVKTQMDIPIFVQHNRLAQKNFDIIPDKGIFICSIPTLPLPASTYKVTYSILSNQGLKGSYIDNIQDAVNLTVVEGDFFGSGEIPPIQHGVCLVKASWTIKELTVPNIN